MTAKVQEHLKAFAEMDDDAIIEILRLNPVDFLPLLNRILTDKERISRIATRFTSEIKAAGEARRKEAARRSGVMLPLSWNDSSVGRFMVKPPPKKYIFKDIIQERIAGMILAAGGTGKSFFMLQLGIALATGKNFDVFRPERKRRVLYVAAEDPETELHHRCYAAAHEMGIIESHDLRQNLGAVSVVGRIGPIIARGERGNPERTEYFDWLSASIAETKAEVVLLDPMSRLFGLNENDNGDGTAFIGCLEALIAKHGVTILVAHHESKASAKNASLQENSGRGASSFFDGARAAITMRNMTTEDAKLYGVNQRDFVEVDLRKVNYSGKTRSSTFFRRGNDGILIPTNLAADLRKSQAQELVRLIAEAPEPLSRSQLLRHEGNAIAATMKEQFKTFQRCKDLPLLITKALEEGYLTEVDVPQKDGTKTKKVLSVQERGLANQMTCKDLQEHDSQVLEPHHNLN